MSTVMRPTGPLPPRIYWTRRLLLIGLLMVLLAVVWYLIPGGGGSSAASANPGSGKGSPTLPVTTHDPSTPSQTTTPTHPAHTTPHHPTQTTSSSPRPQKHTTPVERSTPPPVPTGACDPGKLTLSVDVGHAVEGRGTRIGLRMATTDGSTCTLGVTPSGLEIEITSGEALIWHSTSCPDGLPARNVVVQPRAAIVYSIHWDGHIDSNACRTSVRTARPGGYWVTAALVGGQPARTFFAVVPAAER